MGWEKIVRKSAAGAALVGARVVVVELYHGRGARTAALAGARRGGAALAKSVALRAAVRVVPGLGPALTVITVGHGAYRAGRWARRRWRRRSLTSGR